MRLSLAALTLWEVKCMVPRERTAARVLGVDDDRDKAPWVLLKCTGKASLDRAA